MINRTPDSGASPDPIPPFWVQIEASDNICYLSRDMQQCPGIWRAQKQFWGGNTWVRWEDTDPASRVSTKECSNASWGWAHTPQVITSSVVLLSPVQRYLQHITVAVLQDVTISCSEEKVDKRHRNAVKKEKKISLKKIFRKNDWKIYK